MKLSRNQKIILAFAITFAITVPGIAVFTPNVNAQANPTYIIPLDDWILNDDLQALKLVNILLDQNITVQWAQEAFTVGGVTYPAGTVFIETPFTTKDGLSSDVVMQWVMWESKQMNVRRIDTTTLTINVTSVPLVAPRVVIYYDTSTYDNCLNHYYRLESVGIKAKLVTASEFVGKWWNETGYPLEDVNVFLMPGGALHLWAFPYGAERAYCLGNISEWVYNGGGYIGTCAGSSEALSQTPYDHFGIADADYHREWFSTEVPGAGANEYKALIGPIFMTIEAPEHPVMFGYGTSASRPGYGPDVPLYYYGGPAFVNLGVNITVLANYSRPVAQNLEAAGSTNTIWGEPGIITSEYGNGRAVLFGPHPEWPGPGARMEAQAIFWVAQKTIATSFVDPTVTTFNPSEIASARVNTILTTASAITPYLESLTRTATELVQLRSGDHYNPIGYWFDEVLETYGLEMTQHLNELKQDAVKLQYEYYKLMLLRDSVSATTRDLIDFALALIDSFFNYSESFPSESHFIGNSDWTGNIYGDYSAVGDATNFTGLTALFAYVENETVNLIYPSGVNYTRDIYIPYNEILRLNQTAPSSIPTNATLTSWGLDLATYAGMNVTDILVGFYAEITASWPAGPMYVMYYMFYHSLQICQFKIDVHLLNMKTIGEKAREVCSFLNYQIASEIGAWAFSLAEWQATLYQPAGAFM